TWPILAAHLVGVRGAQLALHLPQQVRELGSGRNPIHQWLVEAVHGVPVDARQILGPELLALQPPRLLEHLLPFRGRPNGHLHAAEIDPAAFTTGLVLLLFWRLLTRFEHPQPIARLI